MPSRGPPCRARLWTDQALGVGRRRVSLATPKLSTQTSLTTSVRTQDLKRVIITSPKRKQGDRLVHTPGIALFNGRSITARAKAITRAMPLRTMKKVDCFHTSQ